MSCNNCSKRSQVIILSNCKHRICIPCIKLNKLSKCICCNDKLTNSLSADILKKMLLPNFNTNDIEGCPNCKSIPIKRHSNIKISKIKKIFDTSICKYCYNCIPLTRAGKLSLSKSILIEDCPNCKSIRR